VTRVGLVSDTHGLIRPEALAALQGSDLIVHGGDIGSMEVIRALERVAPVRAIRGNIDIGAWADDFPGEEMVDIGGRRLYIIHDRNQIRFDPAVASVDVVVSGHSHKPLIETVDGVLFVNPGSAGPRRFTLPVALGSLRLTAEGVEASVQELAV